MLHTVMIHLNRGEEQTIKKYNIEQYRKMYIKYIYIKECILGA